MCGGYRDARARHHKSARCAHTTPQVGCHSTVTPTLGTSQYSHPSNEMCWRRDTCCPSRGIFISRSRADLRSDISIFSTWAPGCGEPARVTHALMVCRRRGREYSVDGVSGTNVIVIACWLLKRTNGRPDVGSLRLRHAARAPRGWLQLERRAAA